MLKSLVCPKCGRNSIFAEYVIKGYADYVYVDGETGGMVFTDSTRSSEGCDEIEAENISNVICRKCRWSLKSALGKEKIKEEDVHTLIFKSCCS